MDTASQIDESQPVSQEPAPSKPRRSRRRKTSHLKKVPETRELREQIKTACEEVADKLPKERPLPKDEMEKLARGILEQLKQPEGFLGWTMVLLSSAFWKDQVAAIPPSRRLFLLPHCLKHAQGCPADYDQFGLDCKTCGACSIADFRSAAEDMGYKVLVAEGSPIVLKIIVSGHVDAVVGVACLNVLEKAIDKILLAGIPCMAVPLLSSDCRNTSVDEDWVRDMVNVQHEQPQQKTSSYLHLMRAATKLFEPEELARIVPRQRDARSLSSMNGRGIAGVDKIAATEAIAYDFLGQGGKHSRPFITLATFDALTGGRMTLDPDAENEVLNDSIRRAAMSIETFHKASLVHDDIQDGDQFRYGQQAMHLRYGTATAINVGDYLIGMGYRLVSRESATLGADTVADILDCLADAHMRLSEGQGAELIWRDAEDKTLTPLDALKVYALKTSPAFEAALFSGARLAGPVGDYANPIKMFSRNIGVAFQILNDLKDWQGDSDNKLSAGGDILGGRPTLLRALAMEKLEAADRDRLEQIMSDTETSDANRIAMVRELYEKADVFELANRLVDKHQQKAEKIADEIEPDPFRQLLYYLIDTVLQRPTDAVTPTINFIEPTSLNDLQIIAR